MEVFILL